MRTAAGAFRRSTPLTSQPRKVLRSPRQPKSCPLCQQAGRRDSNHFLSECRHLPEEDRKYIAKPAKSPTSLTTILRKVTSQRRSLVTVSSIMRSAVLKCGPETTVLPITHHPVSITSDNGATGNIFRHSLVTRFGGHLSPSSQSVHQPDGCSP